MESFMDKYHRVAEPGSARLRSFLQSGNSVGLLKLMMEEASSVPYKTKKQQGASNDIEYVQKLIQEMNDVLSHEFLHVDLDNSLHRNVMETDWSTLTACKRSESGTTGIVFLQCMTPQKNIEVVVSKSATLEDFEKTLFVNRIAGKYFDISCPAVRYIERSEVEFSELEAQIKKLFLPLNEELYETGGHRSPKDLFSSQGIMLLQLVKGLPLCHKSLGQRFLAGEDYYSLGKVFLLDLLIRNTDRLPCRKTMPRPGSKLLHDHGNPGNIMFGPGAGEVWSIDPEMQTKVDPAVEQVYGEGLESVVREILRDEANKPRYQGLSSLFFSAVPGMIGILDASLNEFVGWETASAAQKEAIDAILQMIRIRAHAEDDYIVHRAGDKPIPMNSDEREWREWMRMAAPRAMTDIFEFFEAMTGYHTPPYAAQAFESGFVDGLYAARRFRSDLEDTQDLLQSPLSSPVQAKALSSVDSSFVLRMIERACKQLLPEQQSQQPSKRFSIGGNGTLKSERRRNRGSSKQ